MSARCIAPSASQNSPALSATEEMDTLLFDRAEAGVPASVSCDRAADLAPAVDLDVDGLGKRYQGNTVLDGVCFTVKRGQSIALIGHNGSGKSTLLRCCMRLVEADSGSVRLLGRDITTLRSRQLRLLRARVGFVFQQHNLVPRLSVLSNVLHGAQARKQGPRVWYQWMASNEDRQEAMHCLDRVGLAHLAGQRADRLSGGESQRVAIARALMQRPVILMADEPAASLDPQAGEEIMELFVTLTRDSDLTLLFVSHNLEHALHYGQRIVGLRSGRLVLDSRSASESLHTLRGLYA